MDKRYLAQHLVNEGILSQEDLVELLRQKSFDAVETVSGSRPVVDEHPVITAVRKASGRELQMEMETYGEYMELFMRSLMEFLEGPAVIETKAVQPGEMGDVFYAVSQRMDGDVSIVSGILAEDREFTELASRYSEERFNSARDEIAIDSLEEFLNVVNGVFSIREAAKNESVDLEVPRHGKLMSPNGNQQLILRVHADFGIFYVVLSSDEFM